jgi:hypothetical protein
MSTLLGKSSTTHFDDATYSFIWIALLRERDRGCLDMPPFRWTSHLNPLTTESSSCIPRYPEVLPPPSIWEEHLHTRLATGADFTTHSRFVSEYVFGNLFFAHGVMFVVRVAAPAKET